MDISNFTDSARDILTGSSTLAIQNQNQEITSYHLVYIMLEKKDNIIYQLLTKMDVEVEKFKEFISEELNKIPQNSQNGGIRFSRDVEQVLDDAEKASQTMKDGYIATEHLFLGVLDYAPENLKKIMKYFQITKHKFLMALKDVNSNKANLDSDDDEPDLDILSKFGKNLTELAKENKLEPVIRKR